MKLSHFHIICFIFFVFCFEFFTHSQRLGNDLLSHRHVGHDIQTNTRLDDSQEGQQPPPPQDPFPSSNKKNKLLLKETNDVSTGSVRESGVDDHGTELLTFSPQVLRYESSPVCIPKVSTFTITYNGVTDDDIQLISIAADNPQFYPVMFQPQPLSSMNSIQIRILFLPFYAQPAEATLTISTSLGDFEYTIEGAPAYNAYRLHPFVGYKIPSGVPFEQPITIHNPHSEVLRIREIFTTEEFLSLRGALSSDDPRNGSLSSVTNLNGQMGGDVWELEPGTERTVIHLSMGSSLPGSYMGYVHLKTDRDNIVIPVDLQVLEGGLHATPEVINFGILTKSNDVSKVDLYLMNSGTNAVEVVEIVPIQPDSTLVISYTQPSQDRILLEGTDTKIATLIYKSSSASMKISNKILVITNHTNPALATLEIPYEASSVQGGIGVDDTSDLLFTLPIRNLSSTNKKNGQTHHSSSKSAWTKEDKDDVIRSVTLTNYFSVPLEVLSVDTAQCPGLFSIRDNDDVPFETGEHNSPELPSIYSVPSLGSLRAITIIFHKTVAYARFSNQFDTLPAVCYLEIMTNVSGAVHIPLSIATGAVESRTPMKVTSMPNKIGTYNKKEKFADRNKDKDKKFSNLDVYTYNMGNVSSAYPLPIQLELFNRNPVDIVLTFINASEPLGDVCYSRIEHDVDEVNVEINSKLKNSQRKRDFVLKRLPFFSPDLPCEDSSSGLVNFSSSYFENSDVYGGFEFVIKAESNISLSLFFQSLSLGPGILEFSLTSIYQVKKYHYHFYGVEGKLLNIYQGGKTSLLMGIRDFVNIFSHSTFTGPIKLNSVHTSSPIMTASLNGVGTDEDSSVIFFTPTASDDEYVTKNWTSTLISPDQVKGVLTAQVYAKELLCLGSLQSPLSLWKCLDFLLKSWRSYHHSIVKYNSDNDNSFDLVSVSGENAVKEENRTAKGIIRDMTNAYEDNVETDALVDSRNSSALDALISFAREVITTHGLDQFEFAFTAVSRFREIWLRAFPNGVNVPDVEVLIKSTLMYSYLTVSELFVQIPYKTTSGFYEYLLPPVEHGQAMLFYVAIFNPFAVPISASFGNPKLARCADIKGLLDPNHEGLAKSHLKPRKYLANQSIPPFQDLNSAMLKESIRTCRSYRRQGEKKGIKSRTRIAFTSDNLFVPESLSPGDWKQLWSDDSGMKKSRLGTQGTDSDVQRDALNLSYPHIPAITDVSAFGKSRPGREECLHMVNSVVMVPQYLRQAQLSERHPVFSVLQEPSDSLSSDVPVEQRLQLAPYESDILGPVLFIPPNTANIIYNLSLYVVNNYTGVERIDVVFGSGSLSMQVTNIKVLDTFFSDDKSLDKAQHGHNYSYSGAIHSSTTATLLENSRFSVRGNNRYTIPLQFAPVAKPQTARDYVSVNASNQSFSLQASVVNDGKLDIIIDQIFEGRTGRNLCNSSDYYGIEGRQEGWFNLKSMLWSLYRRFDSWSVIDDSSKVEIRNLCSRLPLHVDPMSKFNLDATVTMDCVVESDYFVLQLVSSMHRSSLLDLYIMVDLSEPLANHCRMSMFQPSEGFLQFTHGLAILFGLVSCYQVLQVSVGKDRPPSNLSDDFEDSDGTGASTEGNLLPRRRKIVNIPIELTNGNQKSSSSGKNKGKNGGNVTSFSYLPKNVNLSDIYTEILEKSCDGGDMTPDELLVAQKEAVANSMQLSAVDNLYKRRRERAKQPQSSTSPSKLKMKEADTTSSIPKSTSTDKNESDDKNAVDDKVKRISKEAGLHVDDDGTVVDDEKEMIVVTRAKKQSKIKEKGNPKDKDKVKVGITKNNEVIVEGSAEQSVSKHFGVGSAKTKHLSSSPKTTEKPDCRGVSVLPQLSNRSSPPSPDELLNNPVHGTHKLSPEVNAAASSMHLPQSSLPPNPLSQLGNKHISPLPIGGYQYGMIPGTMGNSTMPGIMPSVNAIAMPIQKAPSVASTSVISPSGGGATTLSPGSTSMNISAALLPPPLEINGGHSGHGRPKSPGVTHRHFREEAQSAMENMEDIVDFDAFDKLLDIGDNPSSNVNIHDFSTSGNNTNNGISTANLLFPSSDGVMSQVGLASQESFNWDGSQNEGLSVESRRTGRGSNGAPPPGFIGSGSNSRIATGDLRAHSGSTGGLFNTPLFNLGIEGTVSDKSGNILGNDHAGSQKHSSSPPFLTPTSSPRSNFFTSSASPSSNPHLPFSLPVAEVDRRSRSNTLGDDDEEDDSKFLDMLTMPWEDMEDKFGSISRISDLGTTSGGFNIDSLMDSFNSHANVEGGDNFIPAVSEDGDKHTLNHPSLRSSNEVSSTSPTGEFPTSTSSTLSASSKSFSPKVNLGTAGLNIAPGLSSIPVSPGHIAATLSTNNNKISPAGGGVAHSSSGTNGRVSMTSLLSQQEENLFFGANGIFGIQPSTNTTPSGGNHNASIKHPIPVATTNIAPTLSSTLAQGSGTKSGNNTPAASGGGGGSGIGKAGRDYGKDKHHSRTYSKEKSSERRRGSKK